MSINLGIDCCSKWTSVGLSAGGQILSEIHLNISRRQSACLPEAVDNLLALTGNCLCQVDRIVLNTGPGSFTGLRVGLSYGLALAAALDRPVVPVNSLEIIALETLPFFQGKTLAPVLWAKRGYVYGAIFRSRRGKTDYSPLSNRLFLARLIFSKQFQGRKFMLCSFLKKKGITTSFRISLRSRQGILLQAVAFPSSETFSLKDPSPSLRPRDFTSGLPISGK